MEQEHLVKKQLIEIQVNKNDRISDLQEEISTSYHEKIIPYIDECCTALSQTDSIHKISEIVLDIGVISRHNMVAEFEEKIKPLLYRQLAEKITAIQPTFFIQQSETTTIPNTHKPQSGTDLQMLTYFIQTGMLPWWAKKHNKQSLKNTFEELINTSPKQLKVLFLESLKNKDYFQRLLVYFSDASLLKIVALIAPQFFPFLKNYWSDVQQFAKVAVFKNTPAKALHFQQWQGLFFAISLNKSATLQKQSLVVQHLLHLTVNLHINYTLLVRNLVKHIKKEEQNNRTFKSSLPQILNHLNVALKKTKLQTNPKKLPKNLQVTERLKQLNTQFQELSEKERTKSIEKQIKILQQKIQQLEEEESLSEITINTFDQSDEIYIVNAGLILLWPFITRFFQTLGLVKEKAFADEIENEISNNEHSITLRERAALLLQYLVDGITEISEHLLPLNKLLCGIDLLKPLPTEVVLTKQEKEESENILTAVIANNPMWKNLSTQGLQNAYLQRDGILSFRNGNWCLQVEKKTHDITLDQLPWGISVVKLPWMEQILYTEWS